MPSSGAALRADQLALLAGLIHERTADPRIGELLEGLRRSNTPEHASHIREAERLHQRARRLPRALVEELARATTLAQEAWLAARQERDFARFAPSLERVVALKRQEAACLSADRSPYDALLDEYEPGFTTAQLRPLLDAATEGVKALVNERLGSSPREPARAAWARVPEAQQQAFVEEVVGALGFDRARGRVDTATHPSTLFIGPGDCRITTRFHEDDWTTGLLCTLHEFGHWLYDASLPSERWGLPAGEALSLGLHESQARLVENVIGRSREFWTWCLPVAKRALAPALDGTSLDDLCRAFQRIAPGPVRIGSDEVTYTLHIAVRFELEEALVSGKLEVAGLPEAWDAAYRRTLGVQPRGAADGCLQDGHWAAGMFGYFPTYALGNMVAAQLMESARASQPRLDEAMARGDFTPLVGWLREHVYRHGSSERLPERVFQVTGRPLGAAPFLTSLRERYG